MQNEHKLKFAVILPCFNEEKYIEDCLDSIVNQSLKPNQIVVVNDGSTDSTPEIIQQYQNQYPFISLVNTNKDAKHQAGAKIVQAFKLGLNTLSDWDIVFKLDADVVLSTNYFEEVLKEYELNPIAGMVGGLVYLEKNGELVYENISDKSHLRGPIKSYRKSCYEKIGRMKESIGWDTIDEILAQYYGFELIIKPELKVKVQKPTGILYKQSHAKKMGLAMYKMDYGFVITLIAAFKSSIQKKRLKQFSDVMQSFLNASLRKEQKIVSKSEGKYVRKYRWKKIKQKLLT